MALSMLALLELLGVVANVESGIQRGHTALAEAVGVSRESSEGVVIVAGDRATTAAWGPPPWPESRRRELVQTIEAGDPAAIVELGHPPMFIGGAASGSRLVRGTAIATDERLRELDTHGLLPPIPDHLPIRWSTPSTRLPRLPAAQVTDQRVPARTFAGRVVVLGLTDPDYALPIATPVGPLSLVEIEAHALTGWADQRIPVELAPGWSILACVLVVAAMIAIGSRIDGSTWLLVLTLAGLAVLLADFALAELGLVRLSAGRLILTALALAGTRAVVDRIATRAAIDRLHAWVERELVEVDARTRPVGERELWATIADQGLVRAQALAGPCASVSVLEGSTLRANAGLDPSQHAALVIGDPTERVERCRSAIWSASLTRRARWTQLLDTHKSLIVPLPASGSLTPLGVWLVHLPFDVELARADITTLELQGREFAAAIEWQRDRAALREDAVANSASARLDAVASGLRLLCAAPVGRERPERVSPGEAE